jgi:hypothetical protein
LSAFASAIRQGLATIGSVAGETVTYWRGLQSVELTNAVPGTSEHDSQDVGDGGAVVAFKTHDWIFDAAELELAGVRIEPKRGDQIRHTVAGVEHRYEVLADGRQTFRYCDRDRTRIRVHTNKMT